MPVAQLRLYARNISDECHGGFCEHEPVGPHRQIPMQPPSTCPGYMDSGPHLAGVKHLSWASFRNGAKVQMEGKRGINRGPRLFILGLVLDSLTRTNTHSSSYLIDMNENCLFF